MSLFFLCELRIVITIVMVILTVDNYHYSRDDETEAQKGETIYLEIKVQDKALVCGQNTSAFLVK